MNYSCQYNQGRIKNLLEVCAIKQLTNIFQHEKQSNKINSTYNFNIDIIRQKWTTPPSFMKNDYIEKIENQLSNGSFLSLINDSYYNQVYGKLLTQN